MPRIIAIRSSGGHGGGTRRRLPATAAAPRAMLRWRAASGPGPAPSRDRAAARWPRPGWPPPRAAAKARRPGLRRAAPPAVQRGLMLAGLELGPAQIEARRAGRGARPRPASRTASLASGVTTPPAAVVSASARPPTARGSSAARPCARRNASTEPDVSPSAARDRPSISQPSRSSGDSASRASSRATICWTSGWLGACCSRSCRMRQRAGRAGPASRARHRTLAARVGTSRATASTMPAPAGAAAPPAPSLP